MATTVTIYRLRVDGDMENSTAAVLCVMCTGRVPKIQLLRPEFVVVITFELMLLIVKRLFGRGAAKPPLKSD